MPSSTDFRDFILDSLAPLGGVSARAAFSGFCLYRNGTIFALISDDTLYFKAGGALRSEFEAAGMVQFRPRSRGGRLAMPYFETPPDILEDSERLVALARKVLSAQPAPEDRIKLPAREQTARPAARPRRGSRR